MNEPSAAVDPPVSGFETDWAGARTGLVRRVLTVQRHLTGLALGGLVAYVRDRKQGPEPPRGGMFAIQRLGAGLARPFVDRELALQPFPVQFRLRLQALGPAFIKLGQILSLREDLLPRSVTSELKNLLDRLPAAPFPQIVQLITLDLGREPAEVYEQIEPVPLGSASIAQTHRATTRKGESVILKVVKPGVREILRRDLGLLRWVGAVLQVFAGRYQPRRIIDEFCTYTLREVDLTREADNAETFEANFQDMPDVVFPKIWREYSGRDVLCMEFLAGVQPSRVSATELAPEDRKRLVDLGAAAIIRMIYQDGFFHADLHPGNLLILSGGRCGFLDLGMVGRFDDELRRTMLYYYYCLVLGDADNAARYLTAVAFQGPGADPVGFRREVADISRRWTRHATFEDFSLGRLILESVNLAGQYRLYFPVEMVLMTKALITFEGVGYMLEPNFDAREVSREHINRVFLSQFHPMRLAKEGLRGAPEILDAMMKAPNLVTEGLRFIEKTTREPQATPLAGMRGTVLAGFCIVAGTILVAFDGPWPLWALMFLVALMLVFRGGD